MTSAIKTAYVAELVTITLLGLVFEVTFIASALAGFGRADPFSPQTMLLGSLEVLVVVGLFAGIAALVADHAGRLRRDAA